MPGMDMNIRAIRHARGLTIDQVAEITGLSRGYLSLVETGKRTPGMATLEALAVALRVPVARLMVSEGDSERLMQAVDLFRTLAPEDQETLILMAEALARKKA